MTEDTRLMASLKKVKNIRQYVFSGRTGAELENWPEKTDANFVRILLIYKINGTPKGSRQLSCFGVDSAGSVCMINTIFLPPPTGK